MTYGDGHDSALPPVPGPLSPEMEAVAGYVAGLVVACMRAEVEALRESVAREMETAIRQGVRPVMVSAEYLAHLYSISAKTVHRRCRKLGIPRRDMHGRIKQAETGLTFYSLDEWEARGPLHTRSVTNALRQRGKGGKGERGRGAD